MAVLHHHSYSLAFVKINYLYGCCTQDLLLHLARSFTAVHGLSSYGTQAQLLCGIWDLNSLTRD